MPESDSTIDAAAQQADAAPKTETLDDPATAGPAPYLKVFGPDTGVFRVPLSEKRITIGRAESAQVQLNHPLVSRVHAFLVHDDGVYIIEDANSSHGTTVNGRPIETHTLRHGDSIQIAMYVIQFRTHPELPGASEAAGRARQLLNSDFHLLPSTMSLRVRHLCVAAREIFRSGDTLTIGRGGLLVPVKDDPADAICLELDLIWPNDRSRRYLGEILGVIPIETLHWMCVKLHQVPREVHDVVVEAAAPDEWIDIAPT